MLKILYLPITAFVILVSGVMFVAAQFGQDDEATLMTTLITPEYQGGVALISDETTLTMLDVEHDLRINYTLPVSGVQDAYILWGLSSHVLLLTENDAADHIDHEQVGLYLYNLETRNLTPLMQYDAIKNERSAQRTMMQTFRPAFDPTSGQLAIYNSENLKLATYDAETGEQLHELALQAYNANPSVWMRWSPDGSQLFIRMDDNHGGILDATSGELRMLAGEGIYQRVPQWSQDGRYLLEERSFNTSDVDTIRVIDTTTGEVVNEYARRAVNSVEWGCKSDWLHVTTNEDSGTRAYMINIATGASRALADNATLSSIDVQHFSITSDCQWLIVQSSDNALYISDFDLSTARLVSENARPWQVDGQNFFYAVSDGSETVIMQQPLNGSLNAREFTRYNQEITGFNWVDGNFSQGLYYVAPGLGQMSPLAMMDFEDGDSRALNRPGELWLIPQVWTKTS